MLRTPPRVALLLILSIAAFGCAKGANERADAGDTVDAGPDAKDVDPTPDAGPECGNAIVESLTETCDDGNAITESCPYGVEGCNVCDATCHTSSGATSFCGDTITDASNGETCDDGNTVTEVCAYGLTSCMVCDATCHTVAGAVSQCGDLTVNAPTETCDDGNTTTEACAYGVTSCMVCNGACQRVAGETSLCGDGVVDAPDENCDDGNAVTEACTYGLTSCSVCTSTCHTGPGLTSYCNDAIIDTAHGEECEDLNTAPGDGCSPACFSESFESEPNDDGATSTGGTDITGNDFSSANPDGPFNVSADEYHIVSALFPAGDEDVFALTSPGAAHTVTLETFGPDNYGACSGIDTGITVRDAAGTALASDDDSGISLCSRLVFTIAANQTVYVHITEFGDNSAISRYFLVVTP